MNRSVALRVLPLVLFVGCTQPHPDDPLEGEQAAELRQELVSTGPRTTAGGCPAEYGACESVQDWLDHSAGGGGGGSGGGGGGGGIPRTPGTGCDPASDDFRDRDNWTMAQTAVKFGVECARAGNMWEPVGHHSNDANEDRVDSIRCWDGDELVDELRAPTTAACLGMALHDTVEESDGEGLIGTPTRLDQSKPPEAVDPSDAAADEADAQKDRIDRKVGREH